ncbi:zeta toxin family protein [Rickettsia bellii]|uniref:Zeta toxin domain-containing protein n=1 Tax=Rickettsia bellii (strain RML369-C) TaxID=336407 RepID=Q1RIW8_RICBR|nr:zeta toxin family protein [Rickettsia bellii]ABE04696.1 unknown [Rickettsia bellii RML369-C]
MKDKPNEAWEVTGVDTLSKARDLNNTRTDPEIPTIIKNSENHPRTTAEHIILTGTTDLTSVASLPATHMAKYASLAIINTNLQIEKEADLKPTFEKLYSYVLDYSSSREFKEKVNEVNLNSKSQAEALSSKVINNTDTAILNKEEKEAKNLYEAIKENYHKLPESSRSKTPEQYLEKILFDKIKMKALEDTIISDLEPKLVKEAENQGFKKLTEHSKDRTTYCFYGAPASGKGTSVAMRRKEAIEQGKNWSDIVKINTDSHRDFITTSKIENKSPLNHAEAGFISNMSYRLYEKKVNDNKAPDMLVDTIMPNQYILDMAVKNGGKALIDVISIPAEKCVERAYERGKEEGRLVPREYNINANINVPKNFHDIMSKYTGKNIEYKIVDNDVERGKKPILIEQGNLKEKKVEIHDKTRLDEFLRKQNLNPKAQNPQELYSEDYSQKTPTYKFNDSNLGIKVSYTKVSDEAQMIKEQLRTRSTSDGLTDSNKNVTVKKNNQIGR